MKILVIGSGGREHALAWKLGQTAQIFCAPGNAGTALAGDNIALAVSEQSKLARFAKENHIDLTVIGPDDALAAGIVDRFEENGLVVFGPNQKAARLESSKIFAKEMMRAQKIPTARAETFSSSADAITYCAQQKFPLVIKADGLALGKGVIIAEDRGGAEKAIREMMDARAFGEAGAQIVIEEFLRGSECSVQAFVSGNEFRVLGTARDHKRALECDRGPNTGGMGAVSPAEPWTNADDRMLADTIMTPLLRGLREAGVHFRGLLFPGLMLTSDGARVLEFNCRFGDPETQAILPRLKSDLAPLLLATIHGELANVAIELDPRIAVTVILASGGYPGKYETGKTIEGLATAARLPNVHIFHAGTKRSGDQIVSSGGRVLAVTALGDDIAEARARAYAAVEHIHFEGCHFRRDIALAAGRE
ncbi:MAG: phosphoribosylamine--glycine ligase [Verrucomicrobiota bacterium]|nr:phosphoribosylamine--glycine ligase [Verrucomicrobiota bacterium]